jgi:hypothetical protein
LKKDGVVALTTLGKEGPHMVMEQLHPYNDDEHFLIKGAAAFITSGPDFEATGERFKRARAALAVTLDSVTQTL